METTGLHTRDRVVSLGAVRVEPAAMLAGGSLPQAIHLIFDPGRKSAPEAEHVHGYDDWLLRHQDRFAMHARDIELFIGQAELVVSHNAQFDLGFINRELALCGRVPIELPSFCTLHGYRELARPGSASLDAACAQLGLKREGTLHGALEDACLAADLYFFLRHSPLRLVIPAALETHPSNLKACPPLPEGGLPRRRQHRFDASPAPIPAA